MARPLRLEYPGALHHVIARGNARLPIVEGNGDRRLFLAVLAQAVGRFNLELHAYCLMTNHYHLLIETPDANLSEAMRQINGIYTQSFNRTHGRSGHLFQGRFKSILVEKEEYLAQLCRYIVLNPVRAGMTDRPEHYPWSSYRATAGYESRPAWLSTTWLLSVFADSMDLAQKEFRHFVQAPLGTEDTLQDRIVGGLFLGGQKFRETLSGLLKSREHESELSKASRFANRPSLEELFPTTGFPDKTHRDKQIAAANRDHGYSCSQIGKAVGLHYSSVSKILKKWPG